MVCGVVSMVGINFGGCGLLLVVASDGYLAVICSVDWDLDVICNKICYDVEKIAEKM